MLERLKTWARASKRDILALYLAGGDPRVLWYAKIMALATAAYALSPIALIPDFIPLIGFLDDLIIVPAAILVTVRMIPADVMADLRMEAEVRLARRPRSTAGTVAIMAVWLVGAVWIGTALHGQ